MITIYSFLKKKIIINLIIFIFIIIFEGEDSLKIQKPKVSVFLPIYNKELYLNRSINSIQNQNLKEIEIVAVNDGSTDYSLKILKQLSKNDKRMKIINNDRNHGLLYSRAMGIINSSGEYLMNLDPDDKLQGKESLAILYHYSKKYNLDFIKFLHKRIPKSPLDINFCINTDKKQLQIADGWITNKFIKNQVFIKAYNNFKNKIYLYKWNYREDNIWSKLIYRYTKTNLILKRPIYLIMRNNESLMARIKNNKFETKNRLYRLEAYINYNLVSLMIIKKEMRFFKDTIQYIKDKELRKKILRLYFKYIDLINKK